MKNALRYTVVDTKSKKMAQIKKRYIIKLKNIHVNSLYWISHQPRVTTESAIFLKSGLLHLSTPLIMIRVQCFVMLRNVVQCFVMLRNVVQCYVMFRNIVQCFVIVRNFVQCFVMFYNVLPRFLEYLNKAQIFMICGKVYANSLLSNYT